jgi:hypothetical protein
VNCDEILDGHLVNNLATRPVVIPAVQWGVGQKVKIAFNRLPPSSKSICLGISLRFGMSKVAVPHKMNRMPPIIAD